MKVIGKITLTLLVVLIGSSLVAAASTNSVFAQYSNPVCPPGYFCQSIGIPGSTSDGQLLIIRSPFDLPTLPPLNPGQVPVIPCILYHVCFPGTAPPFLQQPNSQIPFAPLQSFAPVQPYTPFQPTFGRSFLTPAFTTNTTVGDFTRMVIAQHELLYNKSGLSEPQASIAGLQTLASVGAITPNEFSQLSQIAITLASNMTSAEKTNRINTIDQTLKSQGASSTAIAISDAAANSKPINPMQVGLKPTLTAAHSGSSSAAAGYQYGIAGAVIGAAVGGPVGAAVGGFGGAILGAILSILQ
jgi:hypothetical protein